MPISCSWLRSRLSGTSATTSRAIVAISIPSMPAPVGGEPADEAAGDLADRQEHRVQAHDRAAIGREALGDVGQQAERGRRRPGQHEQAGPGERGSRPPGAPAGRPAEWLTTSPAPTSAAPPTIPYRMIVVRRIDLKRLPQYSSPTPNTMAMTIAAAVIWLASKPCIRVWSGNARVGLRELEQRLAEPQPDAGVDRDPGRRQEQDVRRADERGVAGEARHAATRRASASPAGSLTPRQ